MKAGKKFNRLIVGRFVGFCAGGVKVYIGCSMHFTGGKYVLLKDFTLDGVIFFIFQLVIFLHIWIKSAGFVG
jgi:hypothetical protein